MEKKEWISLEQVQAPSDCLYTAVQRDLEKITRNQEKIYEVVRLNNTYLRALLTMKGFQV